MNLAIYLLPVTGEILLRNLLELKNVRIKTALLPETFMRECESVVALLQENDIRFKFPSDLADNDFKTWFGKEEHDLGISIGYDKRLSGWIINNPELGTINIHPSLLPEYRGANPYFWVIRNKEKYSGVTLHHMDEEFDTGPIIRQETIEIAPRAIMGELFIHLNQLGAQMAVELIKDLLNGADMPEGENQPADEPQHSAPRVVDKHLRINWDDNYEDIEALVRASNPFFGAFSTFGGKRLEIYEVQRSEMKEDGKPGEITSTESGPVIRCKDCWVQLNVVKMRHLYEASGLEFQRREKTYLEILNRVI